jgi:hypothetical protein
MITASGPPTLEHQPRARQLEGHARDPHEAECVFPSIFESPRRPQPRDLRPEPRYRRGAQNPRPAELGNHRGHQTQPPDEVLGGGDSIQRHKAHRL